MSVCVHKLDAWNKMCSSRVISPEVRQEARAAVAACHMLAAGTASH